MNKTHYPTVLIDKQWQILNHFFYKKSNSLHEVIILEKNEKTDQSTLRQQRLQTAQITKVRTHETVIGKSNLEAFVTH